MPQNFYEILGVSSKASMPDIQTAYKRRLGQLVHRKHEAERSDASLVALLREERNLREAVDALTNNKRRRQYDIFREASEYSFPSDGEQLWELAQTAMVDQTVLDSLRLLASLTRLPLQDLSLLQTPKQQNYEEAKTIPRVENIGPLRSKAQQKEMLTSIPKKQQRSVISKQRIEEKPAHFKERKNDRTANTKKSPKFTLEELAKKYGHDGRFLRAVREARGYSIAQVSQLTRITPNYIMAIEQNAFAKLPSSTYVKGYIKSLVRTLEIEDRAVVDDFMMLFEQRRS